MANGANEPPQGIFISYRREDAGPYALLLWVLLGQFLPGSHVFRDSESIRRGADFRASIKAAIDSSAVVLVVIGPKWLTIQNEDGRRRLDDPNDYVAWEIKEALSSPARRVIPVPVEREWSPLDGELPEAIRELAGRQASPRLDHENAYERVAWLARDIEQAQEDFARSYNAPEGAPSTTPVVSDQTSVPDFVAYIKRLREGDSGHPPAPANAMATLRVFAYLRSIEVLVGLRPAGAEAGGFAPLDAVAILTLAAVDRPPKEAAELAGGLRGAEGGPSGLTASIIHDLAAQRTVPHVAEFIAECKSLGHPDLVAETLTAFVRSGSRVSLDKALLYFELLRYGCAAEAKALLAQTLDLEGQTPSEAAADREEPQRPLAGVIGEVGIVGALRHLSPNKQIVEDWIDERMDEDPANWDDTVELVARLLRNEPNGDELLARHVARRWRATPLVKLCTILAEAEGNASPGLRLIWRSLAKRQHELMSPWEFLADVIGKYYSSKSTRLTDTFPELLTEIVTGGADSPQPCPVGFIGKVASALKADVPARCRSELLTVAATHPERRSGADVAQLLIWLGDAVRRPARRGGTRQRDRRVAREFRRVARQVNEWFDKDLWHVAQQVNEWYATGLATRPFEPGDYIQYLTALREHPTLTFWAVRELTDPAGPKQGKVTGEQTGAIAVSIYDGRLPDTAFDLLERYLENEQAVTWRDVMDIVGQVEEAERRHDQAGDGERANGVPMRVHGRWEVLFGATIGRWTDTDHRQEVWERLYYDAGRENTRHQGRDYTREAAAIMSLSQ